jgi:lipopolysaccharide export system protein LptA
VLLLCHLRRPLWAVALLLAGLPGAVAAQDPSCEFQEGTLGLNTITLAGGARITYLSRPRIGCPDGVRIRADSAISYSAQDLTHLIGNVYFRDGARELRSREARYFPSTGRLQAQGDVRLEDLEDGSVIENGDLVLLRQNDFRDEEELTVTTSADGVRPRATLFVRPAPETTAVPDPDTMGRAALDTVPGADGTAVVPESDTLLGVDRAAAAPDTAPVPDTAAGAAPPDTAAVLDPSADPALPDSTSTPAEPPSPWEVEADRLHLVGEDRFEAVGDAVIQRDSIDATAARADYDGAMGTLVLRGAARLEGPAYDLAGEEIVLTVPGGGIREVTARRNGILTGEDIRLDAPVIHLFLVDGELDRLVATPLPPAAVDSFPEPDSLLLAQPVATAEAFVLTADSVDVRAPGQELDRIHAVGTARGVSMSRDSLNVEALPKLARQDWLEGDTIIATFRPAAPGERSQTEAGAGSDDYVLEELVAVGSARSLYRLLPSDSTARAGEDPPAVHYVTGSRITVAMRSGDVEHMEVEGPSQGFHLEPRPAVPAAVDTLPADTSGAAPPPDTLPADTTGPSSTPAAPPPDTLSARGASGHTLPSGGAPGEHASPDPGPGPRTVAAATGDGSRSPVLTARREPPAPGSLLQRRRRVRPAPPEPRLAGERLRTTRRTTRRAPAPTHARGGFPAGFPEVAR